MSTVPVLVMSGLVTVAMVPVWAVQLKQGNSGPISMGIWIILLNIVNAVNIGVWQNDVVDRAPVWCDITIKIRLAGEVGRFASAMCIARFLASVVHPRAVAMSTRERRKRAVFDYGVCFGVPGLVMATHILYQASRYGLTIGLGCYADNATTWPFVALYAIWPPIFAVIATLYALYVVYRLLLHRLSLRKVMSTSASSITTAQFARLLVLALSYLAIGLPLCMATTVTNIVSAGGYVDYFFDYVHLYWGRPIYRAAVPVAIEGWVKLGLWSNVIVGLIYVAVFAFGMTSRDVLMRTVRRLCRLRTPQQHTRELCSTTTSQAVSQGSQVAPYNIELADRSTRHVKICIERSETTV